MRFVLVAAASIAALTAVSATPTVAAPAALVAVQSDSVTDAEVAQFATAMKAVMAVNAQVQNGTPTPEQQAAMATAIEDAGLTIERFNAISAQVSTDRVLNARLDLARTEPSPAGSVGAAVTDAEVAQFAKAMADIRPISQALNGAAPTAEQQAAMSAAITDSGLTLERFNAVSAATSRDAHLRARIALADIQAG
jgi:hypothetical protein